jgi:hypothetical protein
MKRKKKSTPSKQAITIVARDAREEAVDFADEQIFAPAEEDRAASLDGAGRRLQQVLREMHDGEINAGLQTFAWGGVRVWIGDELNGRAAEGTLTPQESPSGDDDAIAHWLHETAVRLYPNSEYAWQHRLS